MPDANTSFGFPFAITESGSISATGGDEAIRGKIIQVLFTAPGERVNMPEFGCGLFNLVFEPNDTILAAAAEFSIVQALSRWMKEDILVEQVQVDKNEESITIQIVYSDRKDLSKNAVRIHFS